MFRRLLHGPTLSLLDARTLGTKAEALIGVKATSVAVDPVADLVYVTRYRHGTVHVFRGADLAPVQVFGDKETMRGCAGIAFDTDRSLIYLARNFGSPNRRGPPSRWWSGGRTACT